MLPSTKVAIFCSAHFKFVISWLTFVNLEVDVRPMSEEMVFCCLIYAFRPSTVFIISSGTWVSLILMPSCLLSPSFGCVAVTSIPPRPTKVDAAGAAA